MQTNRSDFINQEVPQDQNVEMEQEDVSTLTHQQWFTQNLRSNFASRYFSEEINPKNNIVAFVADPSPNGMNGLDLGQAQAYNANLTALLNEYKNAH